MVFLLYSSVDVIFHLQSMNKHYVLVSHLMMFFVTYIKYSLNVVDFSSVNNVASLSSYMS